MERRKYDVTKPQVYILNSKLEMKPIGCIRKMTCLKNMKYPPNGRSLWYQMRSIVGDLLKHQSHIVIENNPTPKGIHKHHATKTDLL